MKKKIIACIAGIVCLGIAAILGYVAGNRRPSQAPEPTQTFYATVESIADDSLTVQGLEVNDSSSRGRFHLTLSEETALEWNHTAIATADLKPGCRVSVTYSGAVEETDPANIHQVQRIALLEDQLDHLPRLTFQDAYVSGYVSYPGYGSVSGIDLTEADIRTIWNVETLPGISDSEQEPVWTGRAEFLEDGSLAAIDLLAYSNPTNLENEIQLAYITLRPEELPYQYTLYIPKEPTCTLWETPVIAPATGMTYLGNDIDDLASYQEFYVRFMTSGSEPIGFDGTFYAPGGRVKDTKEMMNTLASYCLDPENTFTLKAIEALAPKAWNSDSGFTRYVPEAFEDYYLQSHYLDTGADAASVRLNYSEAETGGGNSMSWTIQQPGETVKAVDITQPETYDLRSNEAIDSSDRFTLGLSGQLSDEAINTLANPVFNLGDLTEDVIAGRIFESYENYYREPFLALSVLYPDGTVVTFEGHWDPAGLYEIFNSLPINKGEA